MNQLDTFIYLRRLSTNGSDFDVLRAFTAGDEPPPCAGLLLAKGALYGPAYDVHGSSGGILFKASLDGTAYAVLERFSGSDGGGPQGPLVLSGTDLYGCCNWGGPGFCGVVYRLSLGPPSLVRAPLSQTVVSGTYVVLTAQATGTPWLTYQWYFNGASPVLGAASDALTLADIQPSQSGAYTVVVANDFGAVTSPPAVLNVLSVPPHIDAAPLSQTLPLTADAVFSVAASGSLPLSYQWYFDATNALAEAVDATLVRTNIQLSDSGAYTVVVANPVGVVTSPPAALTVYGIPPAIVSPPTGCTLGAGAEVDFWVSATGSPPLSYQWFFNGANALAGATNSLLSLAAIQFSQAGAYSVVVTNAFGAVTSPPAVLNVLPANVVTNGTEQALRQAIEHGGNIALAFDGTLSLTGAITVGLDTKLDGGGHSVTLSGSNAVRLFQVASNVTLTLANLTLADGLGTNGGAIYTDGGIINATNCTFSGNTARGQGWDYNIPSWEWPESLPPALGGAICSQAGQLNVDHCAFLDNGAYGVAADLWGVGEPFWAESGWDGYGGAIYSQGALRVAACTFLGNAASGGAAASWPRGLYYDYPAAGSGGSGEGGAIYSLGALAIDGSLFASNSATGGPGGQGAPGFWYSNNFVSPPIGPVWIPPQVPGTNGQAYGGAILTTQVAHLANCAFAWNPASVGPASAGSDSPIWGPYTNTAPVIWTSPASQTPTIWTTVDLTASASGAAPLGYLWFFNGTNALSGATNPSIELTNIQLSQAGAYTVVVTNALGAVTSPPALVEVLTPPPRIDAAPTNQSVVLDASVAFSVAASGYPPLSYQWFFDATNSLPGQTNTTLALADLQLSQSGAYTIVVTNIFGSATSPPALLTVVGVPPAILISPANQAVMAGATMDFSVSASGSVPLAYLWLFNATNLVAAGTGPVLELDNVQFSQAGQYSVLVTNAFGAATSSAARLLVTPPGITAVADCTEAALRTALVCGGRVVFPFDATIQVTNTIAITTNALLDGNGHRVTLSGRPAGLFAVPTGVTFSLANLTVAEGWSRPVPPFAMMTAPSTPPTACFPATSPRGPTGRPTGLAARMEVAARFTTAAISTPPGVHS